MPTYWKSTQKTVYFVISENCQLLNYCQLLNDYGPVTKARRRRKFFEGLGAKPPLAQNPGYVHGIVSSVYARQGAQPVDIDSLDF